MEPKKTSVLVLSAVLAGVGVGRATVPSAPAPKLERICVEADGSAQVYVKGDQLLVPVDHGLAVMHRSGGKAADVVPVGLSKALRGVLDEAGKLAASNPSK